MWPFNFRHMQCEAEFLIEQFSNGCRKYLTWFRLLCLVIGLKESCQFSNQWEAKPKPIAPCTRDFSRASGELQVLWIVIGLSCCSFLLWLVGVIALVLGFRQSFKNRSITMKMIMSTRIFLRCVFQLYLCWIVSSVPFLWPCFLPRVHKIWLWIQHEI